MVYNSLNTNNDTLMLDHQRKFIDKEDDASARNESTSSETLIWQQIDALIANVPAAVKSIDACLRDLNISRSDLLSANSPAERARLLDALIGSFRQFNASSDYLAASASSLEALAYDLHKEPEP